MNIQRAKNSAYRDQVSVGRDSEIRSHALREVENTSERRLPASKALQGVVGDENLPDAVRSQAGERLLNLMAVLDE